MTRPTWKTGEELSDIDMTSVVIVGVGWWWDAEYDPPALRNANNTVILSWKGKVANFDLYARGNFDLVWKAMNHMSRQPKHLHRVIEFAIWWREKFDWAWSSYYAQRQILDKLGSLLNDNKWDR